jgi:hypothetical protein
VSWTRAGVVALVVGLGLPAAAQEKQKFDLKFEKDKPFYQRVTTKVEQTLKVAGGGADVPQKHEQTFYFKWTPISVDKDKAVVKQSIEGVRFKMDIAGQTLDFDSTDANPSGAAGNPGLTEFFKSLLGLEFTVTFGKNGVVEKVDGREQALQKLAAVNPQIESVLKQVLTDEAVKEMTDPAAGLTPAAEQAVGGTWERKGVLNLGPIGSYDRTYAYTYKGKDPEKKELDRVEVRTTVAFKPTADAGQGLPFKVKSGTFATKDQKDAKPGVILYNPKTGRVESVRLQMVLTGDLDLTVANSDTKVALYQDQKVEVDTADASLLPVKK